MLGLGPTVSLEALEESGAPAEATEVERVALAVWSVEAEGADDVKRAVVAERA